MEINNLTIKKGSKWVDSKNNELTVIGTGTYIVTYIFTNGKKERCNHTTFLSLYKAAQRITDTPPSMVTPK